MRLNPDCVRDILLTVEEECTYHSSLTYVENSDSFQRLAAYSHEEIVYHIKQCECSGLIFKPSYYSSGKQILINDLTPKGHEFLADIQTDKVWEGTKSIATKIGSSSLNCLTQIASNVIAQLIKAHFNLV